MSRVAHEIEFPRLTPASAELCLRIAGARMRRCCCVSPLQSHSPLRPDDGGSSLPSLARSACPASISLRHQLSEWFQTDLRGRKCAWSAALHRYERDRLIIEAPVDRQAAGGRGERSVFGGHHATACCKAERRIAGHKPHRKPGGTTLR